MTKTAAASDSSSRGAEGYNAQGYNAQGASGNGTSGGTGTSSQSMTV
ncbi:hypothetical protein [Bradyrhizobium oligotrophicum]